MFLRLMTSAALAAVTIGQATSTGTVASTTPKKTNQPKQNFQNRKGMKNVTFIHGVIGGAKQIFSNSNCSTTERKKIMDSVSRANTVIAKAYKAWPKWSFKKWFGEGTAYDNDNVRRRYKYGMDYLKNPNGYTLMCCKKAIGACGTCRGRVLAYVSAYRGTVKRSSTHIRICPLSFTTSNTSMKLGMTMFHEVMHVTSAAGDKGYSKREGFALAKNNPSEARLNAAAYVYFAAENGYSRADYKKYAGSIYGRAGVKRDRYSNCADLVKRRGLCTATNAYAKYCPAMCEYIANIGKDDGNDGEAADKAGKAAAKAAKEKEERERPAREKAAREKAAREKAAIRPCWLRLTNGCPRIGRSPRWFVDSRGGANSSTCERRRGLYERYCRTKTEFCYAKTTVGCPKPKAPEPKCIKPKTIGTCQRCVNGNECQTGMFCCPYMRLCVPSS